jgi:hypothetical protein
MMATRCPGNKRTSFTDKGVASDSFAQKSSASDSFQEKLHKEFFYPVCNFATALVFDDSSIRAGVQVPGEAVVAGEEYLRAVGVQDSEVVTAQETPILAGPKNIDTAYALGDGNLTTGWGMGGFGQQGFGGL